MAFDLVVKGKLVLADQVADGCVGVEGGRVARVSSGDLAGRTVVDAGGKIVLPGVVDLHAHFSEPGRTSWEGWAYGSRAAAAGGVTTVVDMPLNAVPATVNREAFELKRDAGLRSSLVDFALWGGLVDDNLADLPDLLAAGVMGIKAFMIDIKDDTFRYVDEAQLRRGMEIIAGSGLFLAVHAEDNEGTWNRTRALQAAGRTDRRAWTEARSPEGELTAILRALSLARETGCPLHLVHVSLPEGVEALDAARRSGQKVSWETCAHYLSLTDEDFYRLGPEAKCAPPLRDRARQAALWDQILAGQIEAVTSDHSPCPTEDKQAGDDNIWNAWGGITGIQSLLPVMMTEGFPRGLSWPALARLLCTGPAKLAGLADRKGALAEGHDADFVVVDPQRSWTLRKEDLKSRHPHSVYVGRRFQGGIDAVFLRGKRLFGEGKLDETSAGQFLSWTENKTKP